MSHNLLCNIACALKINFSVVIFTVGGVMGYMKSGSQKSLAAGGVSSLLLYYVYTQLPTNPGFASALGLGKKTHTFSPSFLQSAPCYKP